MVPVHILRLANVNVVHEYKISFIFIAKKRLSSRFVRDFKNQDCSTLNWERHLLIFEKCNKLKKDYNLVLHKCHWKWHRNAHQIERRVLYLVLNKGYSAWKKFCIELWYNFIFKSLSICKTIRYETKLGFWWLQFRFYDWQR